MALPWLRIIDAVIGVGDVVRVVKGRGSSQALSPSEHCLHRPLVLVHRVETGNQAADHEPGRQPYHASGEDVCHICLSFYQAFGLGHTTKSA